MKLTAVTELYSTHRTNTTRNTRSRSVWSVPVPPLGQWGGIYGSPMECLGYMTSIQDAKILVTGLCHFPEEWDL